MLILLDARVGAAILLAFKAQVIAMTQSAQPSPDPRPKVATDPPTVSASSKELLSQLRRAVTYHLSGDYLSAELLLRAVLRADSELPQAHHHLAVVLHAQRQYVDAERHLAVANSLDPHLPGIADRLRQYQADAESRAA